MPIMPNPILNGIFRQSIFEDKIEEKNLVYQDIHKVFLFNFRPKRRSIKVSFKMGFGITNQQQNE